MENVACVLDTTNAQAGDKACYLRSKILKYAFQYI